MVVGGVGEGASQKIQKNGPKWFRAQEQVQKEESLELEPEHIRASAAAAKQSNQASKSYPLLNQSSMNSVCEHTLATNTIQTAIT